MSEIYQSRHLWLLTMRRFAEVAWSRHSTARYLSIAVVPLLVAFCVPGLWWVPCAIFTGIGLFIDRRTSASFHRTTAHLEGLNEGELRGIVFRYIRALAWVTGAYVLPYVFLAFAPAPGPVLGLLVCTGICIACGAMHVMAPRMIFYSSPPVIVALIVNAWAASAHNVFITALAALVGLNMIVIARAGAKSFTDLVVARAKAEAAAAELELRVEQRTAQLAEASKEAQDANRAKSAFLTTMSHELRTPLNAVIGYAEIVDEDIASGDTRDSAADLSRIRGAARHLLTLINEVLDFSRIEAGKLELRPSVFDLGGLLRNAVDIVRPMAENNGATCELSVDPNLSFIVADETRVLQCVLNLLSNAAKFTGPGQVHVHSRCCEVERAPGVAIAVTDAGCGIAPDDLSRLFQPFVQVDPSATRAHEGAGLGLVITRRLARAMGGDVVAESEVGKGSVFTLTLPLDATIERAAAA